MVRRFGDKMAKLLLVIFNFLFLVCGIGICVLSLRSLSTTNYGKFIDGLSNVNYFSFAVGIVIALIAFMGCCGAISENKCMVTLFIVLMTAILIAEISVTGVAFAKRGDISDVVKKEGLKLMASKDKQAKTIINDIQTSLHCCGMNGPYDYKNGTDSEIPVPDSCCKTEVAGCAADGKELNDVGCFKLIATKINDHLLYVGLAALFVAFVEVVGIIFACCLRGAIAERYESV